ncbi:MAG: hypothetical protein KAT27_07370, partial [Desulfobacterales bacterium]|nr:hypothetical protein [Desulfobacterales bacterium]
MPDVLVTRAGKISLFCYHIASGIGSSVPHRNHISPARHWSRMTQQSRTLDERDNQRVCWRYPALCP